MELCCVEDAMYYSFLSVVIETNAISPTFITKTCIVTINNTYLLHATPFTLRFFYVRRRMLDKGKNNNENIKKSPLICQSP